MAALILALPGCRSGVTEIACTLMGCDSGLEVLIEGSLPEAYSVLAHVDGYPPITIECGNGNECTCGGEFLCQGRVFFPAFKPGRVTIEVRAEELLGSSVDIQPDYVDYYPNGPDCPPPCFLAQVVVQVT